MFRLLREDVRTILRKDPAARSALEVLTYAGFWAIFHHRIAHAWYRRGWCSRPVSSRSGVAS